MVHKFATKGGLAQALHKKTRQLYATRLYQTFAIPLPRGLRHLINEAVDYGDQLLNLLELELAIIEERPRGVGLVGGVLLAQLVVFTSLDDPCAAREFERVAPRLLAWYQWVGGAKRALSRGVQDRIEDYKRSRSIFERTPTEATRLFKASSRNSPWYRVPPGSIQVNFYATLEKGKYGPVYHQPDFITSLYLDPSRGVHLRELRETLGAESIAIITDRAPFRTVFEAATDDWLSPMAVWDLTHQCTRPLRVFEHRVSQSTKVKRFLREPIYLALVFICTLGKLMLGYPEKDTAYLSALYGARYARTYQSLGRVATGVRRVAGDGARVLAKSAFVCCVVSVMALYGMLSSVFRTTRHVTSSTLNIVGSLVNALALTASAGVAGAVSVAGGLGLRGWLVVVGVVWLGVAEYCSLI